MCALLVEGVGGWIEKYYRDREERSGGRWAGWTSGVCQVLCWAIAMRAYWMDDLDTDQREPHECVPNRPVDEVCMCMCVSGCFE